MFLYDKLTEKRHILLFDTRLSQHSFEASRKGQAFLKSGKTKALGGTGWKFTKLLWEKW